MHWNMVSSLSFFIFLQSLICKGQQPPFRDMVPKNCPNRPPSFPIGCPSWLHFTNIRFPLVNPKHAPKRFPFAWLLYYHHLWKQGYINTPRYIYIWLVFQTNLYLVFLGRHHHQAGGQPHWHIVLWIELYSAAAFSFCHFSLWTDVGKVETCSESYNAYEQMRCNFYWMSYWYNYYSDNI